MVESRTWAMVIEPTPSAVRTCRELVAEAIGDAGADDDDLVDRALLCASELVTNAIEHARPPADLRVASDGRRVRIEVADSTERLPAVGSPDETSVRGRGLMIVRRCSDRWGVVSRPGGKTVWCELAVTDAQRARRGPMSSAPAR